MITQELKNYIRDARRAGQSDEQIHDLLLDNGWDRVDVDNALSVSPMEGIPQPVALEQVSYTKHFGPLFLLTLGCLLSLVVVEGLLHWAQYWAIRNIGIDIALVIIILVGIFYMFWFGLSLAFYVARVADGSRAAMHNALHRLHAYLWIAILIDLIVQFGYVLLIVPGIIFAIWFSFSIFVLAQEDTRGLNALLKSKEYARGHWWRIFGTILLLGLGTVFIFGICAILLKLLPTPAGLIVGGVLLFASLLLYYPFAAVRFYNLFAKIKNEKGIVSVPAKGRGLFGTFAVLGILMLVAFSVMIVFLSTHHSNHVEHYSRMQHYPEMNHNSSGSYSH